ncbi:MAG TPA: hypothetical protein VG167_00365 [Verrucomicrobiae bacterium]|nr:hypothetical protein [Verrucomicrobiae bacterium]
MNPVEHYQDVLQNIEAAVAGVWREHQELTNYAVSRAYEAAINRYKDEARQFAPKPAGLTGLDAVLYQRVCEMCEWRLGRKPNAETPDLNPIPIEDLVACLRKLHKSVEFWTKKGGRQGYLQFIEGFV